MERAARRSAPRRSLKRAANWSRNINHAFFQRELSCHSLTRSQHSHRTPGFDTTRSPLLSSPLLRACAVHLSADGVAAPESIFHRDAHSLARSLSAFVFSRRTAKRAASKFKFGMEKIVIGTRLTWHEPLLPYSWPWVNKELKKSIRTRSGPNIPAAEMGAIE